MRDCIRLIVVDRENLEHRLEALEGFRVMEVIRDWDLPVKAECGGACSCGTCHVYVDPEWANRLSEPSEEEMDMLDTVCGAKPSSRLSCQILMRAEFDGPRVRLAPGSEIT